jgi:peptidoglycan/LPS O-acetylase OafA/YrhL
LWSMSYEALFYVLLAVYLAKPTRVRLAFWWLAGVIAVIAAAAMPLTGVAAFTSKILGYSLVWLIGFSVPDLQRFIRFPRCCVGALIGSLPTIMNLSIRVEQPLGFLMIAALAAPLFIHLRTRGQPGRASNLFGVLYSFAATTLLVIALVQSNQPSRRVLPLLLAIPLCAVVAAVWPTETALTRCRSQLGFLGRLTYAVYLTHMPVIHFVGMLKRSPVELLLLSALVTTVVSLLLECFVQPFILKVTALPRTKILKVA